MRAVEGRVGLARQGINEEGDFQTWSNGMLTLFEMIGEALYCRIRELKYLVHKKGEVVGGIVDGIVVLAPCLLQFEVTQERSCVVENMLGEAKAIHQYLMDFRKVKGRLREVIDQWYEGSTWIDPREDSDTSPDETETNDILEDAIITQEVTNDDSRALLDLPTKIQDSDLSSTHGEVSAIQDFAEALDIALRQHCLPGNSDKADDPLSGPEIMGICPIIGNVSSDIDLETQRNAGVIWPREDEHPHVDIEHDKWSVYNDNITELVNSHTWIVCVKGEERDFIEDIEYHEKEIWNLEDALEMQRELELDETLFWESDEGRELKADLELDEILFWDSDEGRILMADIKLDEYLMSISEEAMEFEREFELERLVAEEAVLWEKAARLECKTGKQCS